MSYEIWAQWVNWALPKLIAGIGLAVFVILFDAFVLEPFRKVGDQKEASE